MSERRYAVISARTEREVAAYLPDNYEVLHTVDEPGGVKCVVGGQDDRGWTLDGFVIPRLASGMLFAREHRTYGDADADPAGRAYSPWRVSLGGERRSHEREQAGVGLGRDRARRLEHTGR